MIHELYERYPRLAQLLDHLCVDQLAQAGADELSQLLQSDPRACELYVRYLDLHANLWWDLAHVSPSDAPLSEAGASEWQPLTSATTPPAMRQTLQDLLAEASREPDLWASPLATSRTETVVAGAQIARQELTPGKRLTFWRTGTWRQRVSISAIAVLLGVGVLWGLRPTGNVPGETLLVEQNSGNPETQESPTGGSAGTESLTSSSDLPPALPELHWELATGPSRSASPGKGTPSSSRDSVPVNPSAGKWDDARVIAAIDRQIEKGWQDHGVMPSPNAGDYEWVRRIYLDLAGRIPTAEEIQQYVEDVPAQRAGRLVDRLLASPDFAFHWSSRWTNLLVGRTPDARVDRIALQAFLRDAVTENRGWNGVVRDLIAAEGNPRENGAANFLVAHLNNEAVPATAFVARTLLGSQIHCAQCHKHPYYELSQQEFWELNSFFKQAVVERVNAPLSPGETMSPEGKGGTYRLVDRQAGGPTYFETRTGVMKVAYPKFNGQEVDAAATVSRRGELAQILTEGAGTQVAQAFVNRTWSQMFGYGFTLPVDDLGPHNPPTHPELFENLTEAFVASDYDLKRLLRWICLSRPYRLSSQVLVENRNDAPDQGELPAFSRMYFKPLTAEQLYDSLLSIKGDYGQSRRDWKTHAVRREQWVNQFVSSLQNDENDESQHFEGTISQALVMMNGDLVSETISSRSNPLLGDLISATVSDVEKFERLSLSVLSRKPRPEEVALFRKLTRPLRDARNPAERELQLASRLEDAFWAYLNSSEFVINH